MSWLELGTLLLQDVEHSLVQADFPRGHDDGEQGDRLSVVITQDVEDLCEVKGKVKEN